MSEKVKCVLCDGAGKRIVWYRRSGITQTQVCSDCKGRGYLILQKKEK